MKSEFLAGASNVLGCFIKELAVLQSQLKEEEVRAATEENAEGRQDEEEMGFSILWVTQTALEVTRQRLAKERTAKKALQREAKKAQQKYRVAADRAAQKERELEERLAHLQTALDERNEQLQSLKQDLLVARDDTAQVQSELAALKNRTEERANDDTNAEAVLMQILKAREEDPEPVSKELSEARTQMELRDEQFNSMRKQFRFASRKAAASASTAAMTHARYSRAKREREAAKEELKDERARHEALKLTCREMKDLVEALEEAVKTRRSCHCHGKIECKFEKKYRKLKERTRGLETLYESSGDRIGMSAGPTPTQNIR
ncbi:hypothetical protein K438DRAFT_2026477 [Mycena galopus ATCC 62051]|nr:hypothetical protein K438DRAFT_2026477 [Mycena galopus ATCC 62051]